jgi:hypothetical protein
MQKQRVAKRVPRSKYKGKERRFEPTAEKKSWSRNSDAAFGGIFRINRRKHNLYNFLFFYKGSIKMSKP